MELLKVVVVFVVILTVLNRRKPLYMGMLCGTAVLMLLFGIGPAAFANVAFGSITSWATWDVVLAMYVIAVLQRCLDARKHLDTAQTAMNGLFHDQRLNAALASIFIGMMPAAPAVTICGRIIDNMSGEHLEPVEKAALASFYRHIPEGILPTFSIILIVTGLSGVPVATFVGVMLPMVVVLIAIGFLVYLRRVPKLAVDQAATASKGESLKMLLRSLWTIFATIALILITGMPASLAAGIIIAINVFVDKFTLKEMADMLVQGFDWKMSVGLICVFIFKDMLIHTGVVAILPEYFAMLPIPTVLSLALLFFFGTVVGSSNAAGTAFIPLAYSMISDGGVSLLVLLMGFSWAGSQVSPTHLCMAVACDNFKVTMTHFIRKTFPMVAIYMVVLVGYYLLLTMVGL